MKKETPKVDVLARWKNREKKETLSPIIQKAPHDARIPLSNAQKRLWFLQDLNQGNTFYNYGESYNLKGDWSIADLKSGIHSMYEAHDILRSSCLFSEEGLELKVSENRPLVIQEVDFSHLKDLEAWDAAKTVVEKDFRTPFNLDEAPLFRVSIVKLDIDYHILSVTMHHIITDEWSMDVFLEKLANFYKRAIKKETISFIDTEIQFRDFALWESTRTFEGSELKYWKQKLSGDLPTLQLQTDNLRPAKPSYKGAHKTIRFSEELSQGLLNIAKEAQVTPFVVTLSLFYTLLHRHTGQEDILIGSPIANRNQKELEDVLGFFVDTLILRNTITSETTFEELLFIVQKNTLDAFSNKDVPFDVLVSEINPERSSAINPFFQVMFVYNGGGKVPSFGEGLTFEKNNLVDLGTSKFDLTLFISEHNGILSANFEYATDLFKAETIDRFSEHLELLAQGVVSNKATRLREIPMLTPKEKELFLAEPQNLDLEDFEGVSVGIHDFIEEIAFKNPDKKAISFGKQSMTYRELNERSNQLATYLIAKTRGENQIIGLCIHRSLEMMVGLLGILKSGAAYVPLDPEYPAERTKYIIEDSGARLILTESSLTETFEKLPIPSLYIDNADLFQESNEIELAKVSSDDLAYVIYTSGSTGKPKGVPIAHKNIIASTKARFTFYKENPSAFLLLSSISFDSSKAGIFWTLCSGGNLVIAEKRMEQDMVAMEETIVKHKISHLLTLPTLYRLMLEHINQDVLRYLKTVIVAGETCPIQLPELHFKTLQNTDLYNEYGPTEATVWCTGYQVRRKQEYKTIPIGKAIDGAKLYLLDTNLNLVPYGAQGEIYITGMGLSQGYLNQEELSRTKFISNPFESEDGQQYLYKSGDLGKYDSDGNLEFLGRADTQVKLRGFRIELDEIENVILNNPAVLEASVAVRTKNSDGSNGILVAYVVPNASFDNKSVMDQLKNQLPKHMVPSRLIVLERFEKLPNGKIDKKSLEHIPLDIPKKSKKNIDKFSNTEKTLISIWSEILGFEDFDIHDNFFEIGGDSLMTIQIIAKARKAGMAISPNQLFEYQTIEELAEFIDQNKQEKEQWDYIVPLRKEGSKNPLFCIHAGGGHIFFYNKLTEYLDSRRPIYALQPSGLYGDKKMHKSVQEMTDAYLKAMRKIQPSGPYNVLVYCFSAAVGNEMALRLKERGEEINLIIMDTMTAPAVLNTPRRLKIRTISFLHRFMKSPFRSLWNMIIAKYSILRMKWRSSFENDSESKELEKLRLNLMQLSQSYQWTTFDGNVSLILTKKDHPSLNRETVRSWNEIAQKEVEIIHTPGSHRVLFDEPYVKNTAEAIEKCMFDS